MRVFGQGRAAIVDDHDVAERLGWGERRRSAGEPELVLARRDGDPRREPWVAPCSFRPGARFEATARDRSRRLRYLDVPGVDRYLRRLAEAPRRDAARVAISGLGRVGGIAATVLAATPVAHSGIGELLVLDAERANLERWLLELGSIGDWRGRARLPRVRATTPERVFSECDAFAFAAAVGVPPVGATGELRLVQLDDNREVLRSYLAHALAADFAGPFLVVSDPVDWLAQAAFLDSNHDARGWRSTGLAPEAIAGLGLGVMWARALAAAREEGCDELVARRGCAFGPHSTDVVAFDDLTSPDIERSERLSAIARACNLQVRERGFLPFVGPGVSSVALTLPRLLAGRRFLGSVFLDGLYFGAPARLTAAGMEPILPPMASAVRERLDGLHGRLVEQGRALGLIDR